MSSSGSCKDRHRHGSSSEFLKQIDLKTPKDLDLHLILDNYATHKHPKLKEWLSGKPRFHFHFIPTSSSWLNLVERFFSQVTTRRIRRGTFNSVDDLEDAIEDYLKVNNAEAKPFTWTASAEAIIEKVSRCREIYETLY